MSQSQQREDTTITLLSICYSDGWVTNLRIFGSDPRLYPVFSFHPKYNGHRRRQFGGLGTFYSWHHREGDPNWYLSYIMHPALDDAEPDIEFVIESVHWHDRAVPEWGVLKYEILGPWKFTVTPSSGQVAEMIVATDAQWQTREAEIRAERRRETMPLYGSLYDEVLDVLYRYDPMGIAWMSPRRAEEYNSEARTILPRLSEAHSARDVRRIVVEEFRRWFGDSFRRTERLDELAEEVWQKWTRRNDDLQ